MQESKWIMQTLPMEDISLNEGRKAICRINVVPEFSSERRKKMEILGNSYIRKLVRTGMRLNKRKYVVAIITPQFSTAIYYFTCSSHEGAAWFQY